ncbi:MAG: P1 family peptidase [bacterium]|jgi:L-aminopeptidase/D-esterase-like protein
MTPGPRNSITDVSGIRVGNAHSEELLSGVTVILPEAPAVAAVDCRGGGPGTRETDALRSESLVEVVHAIVLSGGSALGLEAAGGMAHWLRERGVGFPVGPEQVVPIVPSAILFDLNNGGDKSRIEEGTYSRLAQRAAETAEVEFDLGNSGAGMGAKAGTLKGGLGTASLIHNEYTVGAVAAANPFGSVTLPGRPEFWAWPFERQDELGGLPSPDVSVSLDLDFDFDSPFREAANTTLCVVATNARLTRPQAQRLAIMAQDGLARAIRPVHTPFDGDTVFVLSTGTQPLGVVPPIDLARLGMMAADCVARAIARGVYEAQSAGIWKSYRDTFLSAQVVRTEP